MSYARISEDCDVYVLRLGIEPNIICFGCLLTGKVANHYTDTATAMIAHLEEHRRRGDKVPDRCFDRLRGERVG